MQEMAAAFGAVWVVGRIVYGYGYATGGPSGRRLGGILSHLGDIPLFLLVSYTAYEMFP